MPSKKPHVLVVGDVMLDVTIRRDEFRTSQEDHSVRVFPAPSPIYSLDNRLSLGGAGNLAANLVAQGCAVTLWTSLSSDTWSNVIRNHCNDLGINLVSICLCTRATVKARYYAGDHLSARVDQDGRADEMIRSDLSALVRSVAFDAIVMTDYAKGTLCRNSINSILESIPSRPPLFVDPHVKNPELWSQNDIIDTLVLNHAEAVAFVEKRLGYASGVVPLTNLNEIHARALSLRTIVKCGKNGSIGADVDMVPVSIPAIKPAELFDVQGAGDTYLAAYVAARLRGVEFYDSCLLASSAAGVACGRLGTSVVGLEETCRALGASRHLGSRKGQLDANEAMSEASRLRDMGFRVGYTNGCFDLRLHAGHRSTISEAAKGCDFLFVGVDSDSRVSRLKGCDRPMIRARERVSAIAALAGVHAAFEFDCAPAQVLEQLRPNLLFKGLSSIDEVSDVERSSCANRDVAIVLVPVIDTPSTTEVVMRIRCGGG